MTEDAGLRRGVLCAGTAVVDLSKVIDHYPPLDHIAIIEANRPKTISSTNTLM